MIKFLKKIWEFIITFQPIEYTSSDGKKMYIVQGGEPISTVIVEGVGEISIPNNHRPKSLDS